MKTRSQEYMYVQKHLTSIPFFPKVYSAAVSSKHLMQNSNIHEFFRFIFWAPENSFHFHALKSHFSGDSWEEIGVKNRNGDKVDCREGRSINQWSLEAEGWWRWWFLEWEEAIQVCLKGCAVTKDEARTVSLLTGEDVWSMNCSSIQIQVELHKIFCMYEVTFSLQSSLPFLS